MNQEARMDCVIAYAEQRVPREHQRQIKQCLWDVSPELSLRTKQDPSTKRHLCWVTAPEHWRAQTYDKLRARAYITFFRALRHPEEL